MKYFICGFSGAGKSTYLKELSRSKEYSDFEFFDLDDYILKQLSDFNNLGEAIEANGWEWFRKNEKKYLHDLLSKTKVWIALGGGTLTDELVQELKSKTGIKGLWLSTDFETCWERIKGDSNRPLDKKGKDHLKALYKDREILYKQFEKISLND